VYLKANAPEAAPAGKTVIGFNLIHGREVEGDLAMIQARSAIDRRDLVGIFPESGEKDVARAAKSASEAFHDWSRMTAKARAEVLRRGLERLKIHQEQLARILTREIGLTPLEAKEELKALASSFRFFAAKGRMSMASPAPAEQGLSFHRRPVGVCGVLTSGTSPLAAPAALIFPALLAGNTVVWKPSSLTPTSAYLFARTLLEAGLPAGVLNTLNGRGHAVTGHHFIAGMEKGLFQGFLFAGSPHVGRIVGDHAGRSLIHPLLQVGAMNTLIVMPDADLDQAAQDALKGAYRRGGQSPTRLGNLLVHEACHDGLRQRLLAGIAKLKEGNPLSHPKVAFGPMLHHRFATALRNHWEAAEKDGATLLCGGAPWPKDPQDDHVLGDIAHGAFMQPTLWDGVTPAMDLFQTEVLGPSLNLCPVVDFEQALLQANSLRDGRICSLYTSTRTWMDRFARESRAGVTGWNTLPSPVDPVLWQATATADGIAALTTGQWIHSRPRTEPASESTQSVKPLPPTNWAEL